MRTIDIAYNLYQKYAQLEEVTNYYGLLAIYALGQTVEEEKTPELVESFRRIIQRYPDEIRHPYYNFPCYKAGGNAKPWAMMKGIIPADEVLLRDYAAQTMAGEKEANGILCMPGSGKTGAIWVDVITAVTPFLLFCGIVLEEPSYMDFAVEQCLKMYAAFRDEECGLLHQCRGFLSDAKKTSQDHWSRGNGWCYLGLSELVQYLPADFSGRERVMQAYLELSKAIVNYQTSKGLWRQEMTEPLSWEESSGSALFVYGLGIGIRCGILSESIYKNAFAAGVKGLLTYAVNGDFSTEWSCPGCLCPGTGEEKGTIKAYVTEKHPVKNEHHSFGALMLAMAEAHRNGITEVDWKRGTD